MSNIVKKESKANLMERIQSLPAKDQVIELHKGTKKMRYLSEQDWEHITAEIAGMAMLLNISKITAQEVNFVIDFLKAEAKDISLSEFKYALTLNLSEKMEKKVEAYGSIINYVGGILAEYRRYRQKHLIRDKEDFVEISEEEKKKIEIDLMKDIFDELNEKFKKGLSNFSYIDTVKYFNCLKFYEMMPDYKNRDPEDAKKLWLKSKKILENNYASSIDKESRSITSYLRGHTCDLREDLVKKVSKSRENIYKGLLLNKYINECLDFTEDLNELKK